MTSASPLIVMPLLVLAMTASVAGTTAAGAELQPRTIAAFERYARATEAQQRAWSSFLWLDTRPPAEARAFRQSLRSGGLLIERLTAREAGRSIDIPDGLVHHWMGTVFVPGATLENAVALLQDYDDHARVYSPAIVQSRLLSRDGDHFTLFLRFSMTKVITVVVNTEHDARFRREGPDRVSSRIVTTRVAQVEEAGRPTEHELPVGHDGGYLWRLNSYWRFLERDGGTYVQCESISLTRGIPFGFGWMIRPFVTSIPRESLEFTLNTTRRVLTSPDRR
jgi:hypothetical protein